VEDAGDRLRQADGRRAAEAGVEVKPRRLVMLHERASALRGFAREAVEDIGQQKRFK
jgi:hypothetical protein